MDYQFKKESIEDFYHFFQYNSLKRLGRMKIDCKFDGSKITRNYYKVQYLYIISNKQTSLILSLIC